MRATILKKLYLLFEKNNEGGGKLQINVSCLNYFFCGNWRPCNACAGGGGADAWP